VETNGPADATTWYGSDTAAMENFLTASQPAFQGQSSFLGYGVDDYVGYQALQSIPEPFGFPVLLLGLFAVTGLRRKPSESCGPIACYAS
jgi:hypothetical protein